MAKIDIARWSAKSTTFLSQPQLLLCNSFAIWHPNYDCKDTIVHSSRMGPSLQTLFSLAFLGKGSGHVRLDRSGLLHLGRSGQC